MNGVDIGPDLSRAQTNYDKRVSLAFYALGVMQQLHSQGAIRSELVDHILETYEAITREEAK